MARLHFAIDASRATRVRRTGTENYARQITEWLVRKQEGVQWTLFFRDDPGTWLKDLPHVEREILPRPRLWTYTALAPALLARHPDAFWEPAHVLPPTAPLAHIPSLVTVHDLGYEHFPEAHTAIQRCYLQLTTRYHARAATHIAVDSHATRHDLIALYDADPSKISVVHLGVDHEVFYPVTDPERLHSIRERYRTGKRFLLYVGTLQPRKNLRRLVRAFAPLTNDFPDVKLVLAGGEGWLADDLQVEIDTLGIATQVVRPGYVVDADLPSLLSSAEVLVFPSLFEGFGLPVLEAMACGTPVLTSTTSSLREVAGEAALLVDPTSEQQITNALRLLLTQPALRVALRERGLARAAHFTWERSAAQIWELLVARVHSCSSNRISCY
ncbi:MAG: glycosyltransferase family 4 protein [Chloroflexota bacterium]|nr:glycosyltransferase family 4 protein [Chloroflexota bacterium]